MYAANFCHRCGRRLAPAHAVCPVCGAERRRVGGGGSGPPPLPAAAQGFQWVWCHFFRNAFLIAFAICVLGSTSRDRDPWVVGALICLAGALATHVWHAAVCGRGRRIG